MFRITAHSIPQVLAELGGAAKDLQDLLRRHDIVPGESDVSDRPWIQLAYREIPQQELEEVLSYQGITAAGSPVGLPCQLDARRVGDDVLIFSTQQLRAFVADKFSPLLERRARARSFDDFLEKQELSAQEYLAAGVVECTRWCEDHGHAMVIAW